MYLWHQYYNYMFSLSEENYLKSIYHLEAIMEKESAQIQLPKN